MFGTIGNGPEDSSTNLWDRYQWSRRFVDKSSGPLSMVPKIRRQIYPKNLTNQKDLLLQNDRLSDGWGHVEIKGKIEEKA